MQTTKQDAINTIQQLPDNADTEEIIYRLYVLENIRRGQQDDMVNLFYTTQLSCLFHLFY